MTDDMRDPSDPERQRMPKVSPILSDGGAMALQDSEPSVLTPPLQLQKEATP